MRQAIVQSMIEAALRAGADPSVTTVLRDWDYYRPGTSAQPLTPFLVVGLTDDEPYGIAIDLYRAELQVMICVSKSPGIRDQFDRIRASVRSVMEAVRGLAVYGVHIDGVLEQSCTQPDVITESGDIVYAQILTFRLWFEAPSTPPAVIDPEIYLAAYDEETHTTYTTTQAQDPRRIARWVGPLSRLQVSYAFGSWQDRASLVYSAPVTPLSTELPPELLTE